jgi:MerR family transcriptional regulator, light-induced transcriptional regulator
MTSVSQNTSSTSLIRSFWPIIKSLSPLTLVKERAAAKLAAQSVTRAHVARLVHAEIIPRLAAHPYSVTAAHQHPDVHRIPHRFTPLELQAAANLALAGDESGLLTRVHELLDSGMSTGMIAEEYIAQTAQYLGECWGEDTLNFNEVTLGCGRLQSMLRYLADIEPLPLGSAANAMRVLLLCAPQEQHTLGLGMVADAFRRDGWDVTQSRSHELSSPLQTISKEWFDVVCISVGADKHLPWLKGLIVQFREHSRNPDLLILAGGAVLSTNPAKAAACGADACAVNASQTPELAKHLLTRATIAASVK